MNWVLFLHLYQPHDQKPEILTQVVNQSYLPFFKLLNRYRRVKVSININGCLTEQLAYEYPELIERLKRLAGRGQIEFVASAKHHAFLPLIPEKEILRQIRLGMEANQRLLGKKVYQPQGFFSSELAFAPRVLRAANKSKFTYLLVDELSVSGKFNILDWSKYYLTDDQEDGVKIVPVQRHWSNQLRSTQELVLDDFFWFISQDYADERKLLITGNDMELFGHHYADRIDVLKRAFGNQKINFLTISDYLDQVSQQPATKVQLLPATWETTEQDLAAEDQSEQLPYPLWYKQDNEVQIMQWELAWLAISNLASFPQPKVDPDWRWHSARNHLDKGLSSCYWWWSSCRPWWNPDMICEGALHLIKSVRSTDAGFKKKMVAEKLYVQVLEKGWEWHWSGEAQKRIDEFEKQVGHGLYWVRTQPVGW